MSLYFTLKQKKEELATEIYLAKGLLKDQLFFQKCQKQGKQFAIVTDQKVASLYGFSLLDFLKEGGFEAHLFCFKGGEEEKNRRVKEAIENQMFEKKLGRQSTLIALGGGVVLDLAGFVAANFCRGIPLIFLPTSFLAMVDACIGGKVGINLPYGKNLLGHFYPPSSVWIDLNVLQSLSSKEMREGSVELLKHGLIADASLYNDLIAHPEKILDKEETYLQKIIQKSLRVKIEIVSTDFEEKGKREVLNFGHTIGHAIETLERYQISHGEGVALGILVECYLNALIGSFEIKKVDEIKSFFQKMNFPLVLSSKINKEKIKEALFYDKKIKKKTPRFVLLDKQKAVTLPNEKIDQALEWMMENFKREGRLWLERSLSQAN